MVHLFNILLYQPILNLLVFFYNILPGHDIGLAIVIVTLIIRLILWPLSVQSVKSQKALQEIQPKLNALKKKYKDQPQKLATAMMDLYRENKVSPFSSLLPLLIQFPILIAVYRVFRVGLSGTSLTLYSFIHNPGPLNPISLGIFNLAKPNLILAIITAIIQYWQTKMLSQKQPAEKFIEKNGAKDENMLAIMNKQMTFMMPLMTIFIGMTLPSGLMVYWLIGLIITIIQQKISFSKLKNNNANKKS